MTFCLNGCSLPVEPSAPTALGATAVSSSGINLTWTDNSNNETTFRIERSLDGAGWSTVDSVGSDVNGYSDSGLASSTQYFYRVFANNSAGD